MELFPRGLNSRVELYTTIRALSDTACSRSAADTQRQLCSASRSGGDGVEQLALAGKPTRIAAVREAATAASCGCGLLQVPPHIGRKPTTL